ncbi:hypothetical protein D9M68_996830 [compost metagenome]
MADDAALWMEGAAQAVLVGVDHPFDIVLRDVQDGVPIGDLGSHFARSSGCGKSAKPNPSPAWCEASDSL